MLDDRVRGVLERLEAEEQRPPGVAVEPTTGRFLFSVCVPQADCEVLEIGGGHGYSTIWLAAAVRLFGGRVLSLERDHECIADWRRNIAAAGLEETAELIEGDAQETLPMIDDVFDVVFLDAANKQYEELFGLAREKLEPGALAATLASRVGIGTLPVVALPHGAPYVCCRRTSLRRRGA